MRILFTWRIEDSSEPIGLMLLSALAKHNRPWRKTDLVILSLHDLEEKLDSFQPDVIAHSARTGEHVYYLEANKRVKEWARKRGKNVFTVLGGPHATFEPDMILRHEHLDAIGVGECIEAWPKLLDALENGHDVSGIKNIITRGNFSEKVRENTGNRETYMKYIPVEVENRFADLDSLPYFDRELIYGNSPRFHNFPKRIHMSILLGCPFPCTYCFNRGYNFLYRGRGKSVPGRYSVERICDELTELIRQWPTQFIKFYDDVFAFTDDPWLEEFAEVYPERIGLPFHCLTRADIVHKKPRILHLLKQAGIHSLTMSIESGNVYVRNKILERNMSEEELKFSFDLARKLGIFTFANTILGIPVDEKTKKEHSLPGNIARDIQSLDLNRRLRVTYGEFPILFPYPGTKLGNYCVEKGFFDGDADKLGISYQNQSPLNCFSEEEKKQQQNLALLSLVGCLFSGSDSRLMRMLDPVVRFLTAKLLIKLPFTRFYFILYSLGKMWVVKRKIYPLKTSWRQSLKSGWEMLKLDRFRQFQKRDGTYEMRPYQRSEPVEYADKGH